MLYKTIIQSSTFYNTVKKHLESLGNAYVWMTIGTVEFPLRETDLYFGIHYARYYVGGVKKDGIWKVTIKVEDVFDFTEVWNPFTTGSLKGTLGALANDYGYLLQNTGVLTPYKWSIVFDMFL